jgi:class 3 adenylate cyclase
LTAAVAFLLNTGFTALFVAMDASAVWPVPAITNVVSSIGYLLAFRLSSTRRLDAAMWVVGASAILNLGVAGTFFGFDGGAWMYLLILPVMATLFVPRGRRMPAVTLIGGGSVAFAVVALLAGDLPSFLADTGVRRPILFVVALTTALSISGIAFYYRLVAERAEVQAERLLLNILPGPIAERLKAGESPIADHVPEVTVLFCDIVGSTGMADRLAAQVLVSALDRLFTAIDDIVDEHGLEKIKTVGDGYLAVAGLQGSQTNHADQAVRAALSIREELHRHSIPGFGPLRMRFGLHSGPVVAGVIGRRKFSYDVWGDTVNVASRMESTGEAGVIQISSAVHALVGNRYRCRERGAVPVKGKGEMPIFVLEAERE